MSLPVNGLPWPPVELAPVTQALLEWAAWYEGDTARLEEAYRPGTVRPSERPSQYRGGVVGAVSRFFWGTPRADLTQPRAKLHVPVAAELCQASADLLFSDPPQITVEDKTTQDRLEELAGDGLHTALAEAAEVGAALGGVYVRVTWDETITDAPFLTSVHADAAVPEFAWGRLRAVTFWRVVKADNSQVWRHLERHESNADGNGVILHALYEGTVDNLGRVVPLTELPATERLSGLLDSDGLIDTGSPGLAVTYVPNQRPQRRWRQHPVGVHLGRSDLDGVEHLMDALDETYSSWMRDIRLGKARVFVAQSMLDNLGPGRGQAWDVEQEVYAPVNALPPREASGLPLEMHQFAIRYEEHERTAQCLLEEILRCSGYSAQTFGEGEQGPTTATEIESRDRRSLLTRDRKLRLWRPAIADVTEKLLAVDKTVFGSSVTPSRPTVTFADSVQDTPADLAATAAALRGARAASTETLVRLTHPDWDDDRVKVEVAAIKAETPAAAGTQLA